MLHQLTVTLQPRRGPLHGHTVTARGLHGMLFKAISEADPRETNWLHEHPAPKPFSLSPLYSAGGLLLGIRLGVVAEWAAELFVRAWNWHREQGGSLQLGPNVCVVTDVQCDPGPRWLDLAQCPPEPRVGLRFLSPTAFRQGPGHSPLPVPYNVFHWPWRVWQAFAPDFGLPDDWLDWCAQEVFVVQHQIETVTVPISKDKSFTGFVGEVVFEALDGGAGQMGLLQALARLAAYSGVGHKTTMGMGAVERFPTNS
ncbi:MAG: CRISPR system precrRNA processing endoribonuclease RAMP protein Cas6 [Candidatus Promineofilum sp.]|nr:CRISPR system precrRNA processing endoribonuclease RAMP protein Cas6 [Promineifilum sp.]MCW5864666.1 CRISPR system precrRNA processing endoribonuclease RAMP protein Cas6 [Anaerolineae bacterium]